AEIVSDDFPAAHPNRLQAFRILALTSTLELVRGGRIVHSFKKPAWRNWQTRWTQNPVIARSCGFEPLRRQTFSLSVERWMLGVRRLTGVGTFACRQGGSPRCATFKIRAMLDRER